MRAAKSGAPGPPAAPGRTGAPPRSTPPRPFAGPGLLDPDEPGITAKEKARRQVLRMRAAKSGATGSAPPPPPAASAAPAPPAPVAADAPAPAPELPDPDEPGISAKERARRQVLRMRAKRDGA